MNRLNELHQMIKQQPMTGSQFARKAGVTDVHAYRLLNKLVESGWAISDGKRPARYQGVVARRGT